MFSTAQIVNATNAKSFERGRSIAEHDEDIVLRRFDRTADGTEVSADVQSQSGIAERFSTVIACDSKTQEIQEFACTCPAARKYDVMCKHAVATAMAFKRDPESFEGFRESHVRATTLSMRRFLEATDKEIPHRMPLRSARIRVEMIHGFGEWRARFKIGVSDKSYVLSDIGAFADAMRGGSFLVYGKGLGFTHTPEAFDEQSSRVAQFIGSLDSRSARREVSLSELEAAMLLEAIGDAPFDYTNTERAHTAYNLCSKEGIPQIPLRIIESEGGCSVLHGDDFSVARGIGFTYIFHDEEAYRAPSEYTQTAEFLAEVYLPSDKEIFISNDDLPAFCANILPALEKNMVVTRPERLSGMMPRHPELEFYFDKTPAKRNAAIELTVKARYGADTYTLLEPAVEMPREARDGARSASRRGYRDEAAEACAVELASRYFDATMSIPLADEEAAGKLLYEGIAGFQEIGAVFTTPDFDRLLTDKPIRVQIGLSISGNLINMDVSTSDVSQQELAKILSSYRQKKHFHRLKNGQILSLENLDISQLDQLSADLGISTQEIARGNIELPTYSAFLLDREYSDAVRSKSFDDYIDAFDENAFAAPVSMGIASHMRPYQLDGTQWMMKLSSMGFGGILADEMGLGKTLQAIAFIKTMFEDGKFHNPVLIVCPASLIYNWQSEFARFSPDISVCVIDGDKAERQRKRQCRSQVFIASYDGVRSDAEAFAAIPYSLIVLDEAQAIKNHATKTSRAIKRLHGIYRMALTGTPIENRLSEIWSIFDFLMPGFLGTYAHFRRHFEADILGGDEDAARRFSSLIGPFVLRRLKSEVLEELPDKMEGVISVELEGEQRKLYDAREQSLREGLIAQRKASKAARKTASLIPQGLRIDVLSELMRLRQVALDPSLVYSNFKGDVAKTDAILELIDEAMDDGKKILVFSQFTSYLDILEDELAKRSIAFYEIRGTTDKKKRVELVEAFNGNDVPVFLVSLKAGGTGLNLTGASVVIHADPWWNAAATEQATDRAHRIGQKNMVNVYKIVARNTIEERIMLLQHQKEELAASVVGSTSADALGSLSKDELESLLFD